MNFPMNQRTGLLSEMAVDRLFVSWSWTVGADRIDVGYDHFVEPDKSVYHGARFLAQTKGTASRKKGRIVAPVAKSRLRQYAANPLPVFIVRALPSGELYWLHAQRWCRENEGRMSGSGSAGVVVPAENLLSNRAEFESYLGAVLTSDGSRRDALSVAAKARSSYLSKVDPRLCVSVLGGDGHESYEISATSHEDPVVGEFQIFPAGDESQKIEARYKLRDHVEFGVPTSLNIEKMNVTGSPVFAEIGLAHSPKGAISLSQRPRARVSLQLVSGAEFKIINPVVSVDANVFGGTKGVSFVPANEGELLSVSAKFAVSPASASGKFTIALNSGVLSSRPLRNISELASLKDWADSVRSLAGFFVVIDGVGGRLKTPLPSDEYSSFVPLLDWIRLLGKAHLVSRYLSSDAVLHDDMEVSEREASGVDLVYRVLKGERVAIKLESLNINAPLFKPSQEVATYVLIAPIEVRLGQVVLGSVEVKVELENYRVTYGDDGVFEGIAACEESSASMTFHEGTPTPENVAIGTMQPTEGAITEGHCAARGSDAVTLKTGEKK